MGLRFARFHGPKLVNAPNTVELANGKNMAATHPTLSKSRKT